MDVEQLEVERNNIEIYFRRINISKLLKGLQHIADMNSRDMESQCVYNNISEAIFRTASYKIYSTYTYDEVHGIYLKSKEDMSTGILGEKSVFRLLSGYGEKTLVTDDKHPVCRYETMLNWWKSGIKMGQDLITTAFLANRDIQNHEKTTYFAWPSVVKSNNERLNKILGAGMAENHFHVNGSTQVFPLSWICLMNNYDDIPKLLEKFDKKLDRDLFFDDCDKRYEWKTMIQMAAVIRWYLFSVLMEDDERITSDAVSRFLLELTEKLCINSDVRFDSMDAKINNLKFLYGKKSSDYKVCFDYAVCHLLSSENENCNQVLSGERFFLYSCFTSIYQGRFDEIQNQLFYLYLVIKQSFRGELIQANDRRGFRNFQNYQDRKNYITKGKKYYDREQVIMSIVSSMESQEIKSLEARFAPGKSAEQIKKSVQEFDKYIDSYYQNGLERYFEESDDSLKCALDLNVFYVVHFIKLPDKEVGSVSDMGIKCRHYELRKSVHKRAEALAKEMETDSMRQRIKGIDAASSEFDCRPEVMATEFRHLRYLNPVGKSNNPFVASNPLSLKITYHAGEDFNHVLDGLRALDEAGLFLNMQRNDRIGHALALGINPVEYYDNRNNMVIVAKQDLLDDLSWFIYKCNQFDITILSSDKDIICREINSLLNEIYGSSMEAEDVKVTFDDYISAWQLRGDAPELYRTGKYQTEEEFLVNNYRNNQVNRLVDDRMRNIPSVTWLYSTYHYNLEVRNKGKETEKFVFTPTMVQIICELQRKMQFELADKGISIECNPTSNYVIGTFKRIDKHPILQFYNNSLEVDSEEIKKSAQLSVSINTDDQGVFDTSLVNEYTVMAAALEMIKDETGFQKYRPGQVYGWIDDVRKMGLEQSFHN